MKNKTKPTYIKWVKAEKKVQIVLFILAIAMVVGTVLMALLRKEYANFVISGCFLAFAMGLYFQTRSIYKTLERYNFWSKYD